MRFLHRRTDSRVVEGFVIAPEARATAMGADGIAFLHTGTGKLFTSNPVGARIWRRLGEGASLETIAADLSREFAIEIRDAQADARNFVYTLLEKRLVFRSGVRS